MVGSVPTKLYCSWQNDSKACFALVLGMADGVLVLHAAAGSIHQHTSPMGISPTVLVACSVRVNWKFRTKGTALSPYFPLAGVSSAYCTCGSQHTLQIRHLQLGNFLQISLVGMQH